MQTVSPNETPGWRERAALERARIRDAVFDYYGRVCVCLDCGATENLTIDHVFGGGREHRRRLGLRWGSDFYAWLYRNNFPEGFQTMCNPCNLSKGTGTACRMHLSPSPDTEEA